MNWVRAALRGVKFAPLPLQFHLDEDEEGHHITRVSYTIDGETMWVEDVAALWNYGRFSIERDGRKYTVTTEDQETLLALRSICSEVRKTGEIVSPVSLPVLRYLRQKQDVEESEASKEYRIHDEPLGIGAKLDSDPQGGLVAETGYRVPSTGQLIAEPDLQIASDDRYAQVGKDFFPLPKHISDTAREWLHKVREVVPVDRIPEFLKRDLVLLGTDFAVEESEASKEYKVHDEPLGLGIKVDFDSQNGLVVETGYSVPGTEQLVPASTLQFVSDGRYAQVGKDFFPLPRHLSHTAQEWLHKVREVVPYDRIPEFFKRDLVLLGTDFKAVLTDEASKLQILDLPPAPRVRVKADEKGWLEFQLDYLVGNHEIPLSVVRKLQGGHIQPDPYTFVDIPSDASERVMRELSALDFEETPDGYRIPVARFGSLEDFIEHIGGQREVNAAYQKFLDDLEGFEADVHFRLSEAAEKDLQEEGIKLRPYQRAGIHWLTWLVDHHLHGLLADDMGLGKTIQTASALRHSFEKSQSRLHSLVICPKSVIRHWSKELRRCYPSLRIYEYIGPKRDRDVWRKSYPGVVISTYSTVARDADLIADTPLFFLVIDESTKIKNPQTNRAKAVKALNAAHRIALSGTPIENRPSELWSVFDFLMRSLLGKYGTFQRVFETPIMNGDQAAADRLGKRVGPFVLRRLKEDVAKDLPKKIEMDPMWVDLTDEQHELYVTIQNREAEPARESLLRGTQVGMPNILAILTKLKQVCDHPALITKQFEPLDGRSEKFDLVMELIDRIVEHDSQVVVFSHFLDTLSLLENALHQREFSYIRLDGSIPIDERQRRIDRFNNYQAQVALCSLQAVGHGVNLTAANHVIHVDRWWNPAIEDQATDRVHRIGQLKTVFVHRILTSDTLEEKIATLQDRKRGLSDDIMGAATQQQLHWTREELLELLKPLD